MSSHFLRIEKASLKDMDGIILFIEESAQKLSVPPNVIRDVVLATMEAVSNILSHGYKETPGWVEIEIKRDGNSLAICFRDLAEKFDPTQVSAPDISLPIHQRPTGGLGVHLIRNFMDELIHRVPSQGGNELICIKKDIFPRLKPDKENPAMEITLSQENGKVPVTVFRVKGNVISETELEARAKEVHDAGGHHILLDLSEVPYMSSAGLRALHTIFSLLRTDGESDQATKAGIASGTYHSPNLKLYNPNDHVTEVLKTAGYDMFLEIHTDYQKAIHSF